MKSAYCLCIFVCILLLSRDTNGGLVRGFFEKVHDAAHKVHEDIHNAFHPTEKSKKETVTVADLPDNNKKNEEPIFIFVTTPVVTTPATNKDINKVNIDQSNKPNDKVDESQFVFASNPTPQPAVGGSTTTEKDGRENFTGGCSTGYQRTADGRCKPTF